MREPNHRLALARQRKEALLPRITRLLLKGHTTRAIAKRVGVPKTTILRWLEEVRRRCAKGAVANAAEIIDTTADRYHAIYRKALKGWDRSLADKTVRTVEETEMAADGTWKKKTTTRFEPRDGNAAFLAQARATTDSIRKLKGKDPPLKAEIGGLGGLIELEALSEEDLAHLSQTQLRAMAISPEAADEEDEATGADQPDGLHRVYQARLQRQLAPQRVGQDAGSGGDEEMPAADGLHAAPARQERTGLPPLPGLPPGQES
jgi:hypothetical protein